MRKASNFGTYTFCITIYEDANCNKKWCVAWERYFVLIQIIIFLYLLNDWCLQSESELATSLSIKRIAYCLACHIMHYIIIIWHRTIEIYFYYHYYCWPVIINTVSLFFIKTTNKSLIQRLLFLLHTFKISSFLFQSACVFFRIIFTGHCYCCAFSKYLTNTDLITCIE